MNSNMNCSYCGKNADCIPFDGGFCMDTAIDTPLEVKTIERSNGGFRYSGGYDVLYKHVYGYTRAYYDLQGNFLSTDSSKSEKEVLVPLHLIAEQTKCLDKGEMRIDILCKPLTQKLAIRYPIKLKERTKRWQRLPMAA